VIHSIEYTLYTYIPDIGATVLDTTGIDITVVAILDGMVEAGDIDIA